MMGVISKPAIATAECPPCGIRLLVSGSHNAYAEQIDFLIRHARCGDK